MWTPVEEIQWFFGLEDFFNALRLIKKITEGDDPVSQYLLSGFNSETRKRFEDNINGPYLGLLQNPMTLELINELDRVLESPVLYEPSRFAGIRLPEEASQLVGRSLDKDDQIRLNRILLDSAYPDEIRRSGRIKGLAAEIIHFFAHEHLIVDTEGKQAPPNTLRDFLDSCSNYHYDEHPDLGFEIRKLCHNLIGKACCIRLGLIQPKGFHLMSGSSLTT